MIEMTRRSEAFSAFAPHVQLDVCDGQFAPVLSWPYQSGQWTELQEIAKVPNGLPFSDRMGYEAHLMVEEPESIGELLARAGCKRVLAHIETFESDEAVRAAFSKWKSAGAVEVGLAVLIDTPLSILDPVVSTCDVIQLMSIATLGAQGAPFDARVIPRIASLHAKYPELMIAIDGGVSEQNIATLAQAGAARFGVGSAISKAANPEEAYSKIKQLAESAV